MPEIIIKTENAVIRQKKNTILKNVSLEIQRGEFIYIIGKVGSGKSSFLKTLYAELPLEYGKAEVAGFQLKKIKKSQVPALRRKCGIVFQDFKLLTDRTVYDNLEFVLRATGWKNKKAIQERIDSVLEKVEMPDKKDKMPHELSGGEQQRIVLARALLNAPPLILADEPTGNIDPETSYRLIELLKDICASGTTVIIATHQYDLLEKYPGKVLRCDNGTLTEDTELSVPPHSLAPEAIESIENIPLEAGEPEKSELPSVLEADILTPVSVNPETEKPDTFLAEEQNVQPVNETVVSAEIKAEEKTVPVQEVIQEPTEQQNTSHTEEQNVQPINETVVSAETKTEEKTVPIQEVIQEPMEQPVNVSEIHPEGTVIPKAVPTNEEEIEKVEETKDDDTDSADEKTKPEVPFGFELIE